MDKNERFREAVVRAEDYSSDPNATAAERKLAEDVFFLVKELEQCVSKNYNLAVQLGLANSVVASIQSLPPGNEGSSWAAEFKERYCAFEKFLMEEEDKDAALPDWPQEGED